MYLHEIKSPRGSRHRRKIVGRGPGSGHGKTSCRGQKGQGARSGRGILPGREGGQVPLIQRLPKVGFRSKSPTLYQVLNVGSLNRFDNGALVNAQVLKEKRLISSLNKPIKILGEGELQKSLTIQLDNFSESAKEKILKAGGKIEASSKETPSK